MNYLIRLEEIFCFKVFETKTELVQGLDKLPGVFRGPFNPDIQVLGVAGVPVDSQGVTPNHQVTDVTGF